MKVSYSIRIISLSLPDSRRSISLFVYLVKNNFYLLVDMNLRPDWTVFYSIMGALRRDSSHQPDGY